MNRLVYANASFGEAAVIPAVRSRLTTGINSDMYTNWDEVLPAAIQSLNPLHQEVVMYVMALPGKRHPAYSHALKCWGLNPEEFDRERAAAFDGVRLYLRRRYGITAASDLESG